MSPFCFLASGGCQNICNIFDPMLFACTDVGGPDGAAKKLECNFVRIWLNYFNKPKVCIKKNGPKLPR